jgi:hypothetical protein
MVGENAWLSIDGEEGSFKITIDSEGTWNDEEGQWKYQVRLTNGEIYENGKWVGENDLNQKQKF